MNHLIFAFHRIHKIKTFMMQHGGARHGTAYFQPTVPKREIKISDKFLSWGWGE